MKITIANHETHEVIAISRDVATLHPAWVHEQCGTTSESELQHVLDGLNVDDFYSSGKNLGNDDSGLRMERGCAAETLLISLAGETPVLIHIPASGTANMVTSTQFTKVGESEYEWEGRILAITQYHGNSVYQAEDVTEEC